MEEFIISAQKTFSIIIYTYNVEDYLKTTIDSIINQKLDFKDNVELIIADGGSDDSSRDIALEYQKSYPDNITVLDCENNVYDGYNMALDCASGKYINFIASIDCISKNALNEVKNIFNKNDVEIVTLPIEYLDIKARYPLWFKFEEEDDDLILLRKKSDFIQVEVNTAFIKKEAIGDLRFNTNIDMADSLFINKILLKNQKYYAAKNEIYYVREKFIQERSNEEIKENIFTTFKEFYNDLIDYSIENEGGISNFIQNVLIYHLQDIINIPEIDDIFKGEELDRFWDEFLDILYKINDKNISSSKVLKKRLKDFLIFIKTGDIHTEVTGNNVTLKTADQTINNLHNNRIYLDIVKIKNGFLYISGTYASICDKKYISVEATKSGNSIKEIYEAEEVEYPNTYRETVKHLSIPWFFTYSFDLKIPVPKDESCSISLKVIYHENGVRVPMDCRVSSRKYVYLSEHGNYFVTKDQTVLLKKYIFYVRPHSYVRAFYYEFKALLKVFLSNIPLRERLYAIFYRIIYFIAYPFMKNRKIWLFSDRRDLSGDNGEHFFHYAVKVKDDVKKYFVIESDCEDYERLKKQYGRRVVAFESFKHKFLFMFTEKFMQSQISPTTNNPFRDWNMRLYAGLATGENYFLQHGVARYDMSSWVTKYDKNLALIVTVSDYDFKEFSRYNFEEGIVQTLGFPRYDNLTNENLKKQIVIMPTWRNYIKNTNQLLNSEYYSRFNNLINNERLINAAKEKGYEIILKPHPLMYEFMDVFDSNDYVKIDNVTKHHTLLCDCALMVTDYSSVAFDFVYLKKPVIYYQYEGGSDHHFDISTVLADDKSLEFGPIIKEEDELIDSIINYMENDCKMEQIYQDRVNNFFKYTDKNNSKRVYEWTYKD